jgi:hypothetical protein
MAVAGIHPWHRDCTPHYQSVGEQPFIPAEPLPHARRFLFVEETESDGDPRRWSRRPTDPHVRSR